MVKAMTDPSEKVRDMLFMGYCEFQRAIKDRQYKLVEVFAEDQRNTQRFDIVNDPWEMTNLVNDNEQRSRVKRMREDLIAWSKDWDDMDSRWGKLFWPNMEFYQE